MQTGIIYITISCPVAVEKSRRKHSAGKHWSALAECEQSIRNYRGRAGSAWLLQRVPAACVTSENRALWNERKEKHSNQNSCPHRQFFCLTRKGNLHKQTGRCDLILLVPASPGGTPSWCCCITLAKSPLPVSLTTLPLYCLLRLCSLGF